MRKTARLERRAWSTFLHHFGRSRRTTSHAPDDGTSAGGPTAGAGSAGDSSARHPYRGSAGPGAQHLRYLRDQCDPRLLPDPQLQHPGRPLLIFLPRPGQRRGRPPPPMAGADPGGTDHDLHHAGGGLLHPRHGLHPVHDPLPPWLDLLRHAREQLGFPLQSVHPPVDDPARRERGPLFL